jgi:acetylornithine deacetylase/succinyl-diaminopimelate desuccinylase-like protein
MFLIPRISTNLVKNSSRLSPTFLSQISAHVPLVPKSYHPIRTRIAAATYLTPAIQSHQARKLAMAPQLDGYFKQVDSLSDHFIERLRKAVAIPSVSADEERRPDVVRMGEFLAEELTALGAEVQKRPLGKQPGKEHLELPPVVIARYGNDKNKRTILVYGHYDVQPAGKEDGWATEPFELTIDDKGRMYGRGSTDDKGPVLGWLNAIEAHQKAGVDFPVNLLMCFEGMEEYGSEGLDDFINAEAKKFFADTDAVCISDNYWLGTEKPCLTYGKFLRVSHLSGLNDLRSVLTIACYRPSWL